MVANVYAEVVVAPPTLHAFMLKEKLRKDFRIAAQNCWGKANGAYTGEISADMLHDMDIQWVILGHSERRQHNHETDDVRAPSCWGGREGGRRDARRGKLSSTGGGRSPFFREFPPPLLFSLFTAGSAAARPLAAVPGPLLADALSGAAQHGLQAADRRPLRSSPRGCAAPLARPPLPFSLTPLHLLPANPGLLPSAPGRG